MANYQYRRSQLADYQDLIRIENEIWTPAVNPMPIHFKNVAEYLKQNPVGSQIVAVIADGQVVGFVEFGPSPAVLASRYTWQLDIGVDPHFQNEGIGHGLMIAVKKAAQLAGIHKMQLNVLGTNQKARHFYQREGWLDEGCLHDRFYLGGHFVDDYQMALFLN